MQSKVNTPISRRHFLAAAGLGMTCMLTAGCSITVSSKSSNESEKSPITLIGAYHPLTGKLDPSHSLSGQEELEQAERESDVKVVIVLAEVTPDTKKNITLRNGFKTTNASLTVDGSNTYSDCCGETLFSGKKNLTQLGFHTGGGNDTTLYAGSSENYKQAFLFMVGKNDLENGKTAKVEWSDLTLSFEISQIQEVATPSDMIAQLQG